MTETIVRFENVDKSFGDLKVLRRLSLEIPAGERTAIIGPSGSGKSTLLRLLMTLERPDAGRIEVEGRTLFGGDAAPASREERRRFREIRAKLGMVFQHFNLFPHMTVLENLTEAPMRVKGLSRSDANDRANRLLAQVRLSEKRDAHPGQLSGGQKQRVAIARALAMEPDILLLDEITSALDPELVGEVLSVIRELARTTAMTFLIVTHQMRFAAEIADRVLFMDRGRVIEQGPPDQILKNPRQDRTKAFLRAVLEAE